MQIQSTYILFTTWYEVKNHERLNEYLFCLEKNLINPYISKIYLLYEYCEFSEEYHQKQLFDFFQKNRDNINVRFAKKNKPRSISYLDVIHYANQILPKNQKFIIANTDIYFDETLAKIAPLDQKNHVYALTRYNIKESLNILGKVWQRNIYSQDSWFLQTPFPESKAFDINLGWIGCDNRIAYEVDKAGYQVLNISKSIKSWHVHSVTNQHDLYGKGYSYKYIGKPYLFLPFYSLDEVLAPDFDYPRMDATHRAALEFQLSSYYNELKAVAPENYVSGANEYQGETKKPRKGILFTRLIQKLRAFIHK